MPNQWKPGDDFAIIFSDKTAKPRDTEAMISAINRIANEYGFSVLAHGSFKSIQTAAVHIWLKEKEFSL